MTKAELIGRVMFKVGRGESSEEEWRRRSAEIVKLVGTECLKAADDAGNEKLDHYQAFAIIKLTGAEP